MGTDIRLFVEYDCSRQAPSFGHRGDIRSLSNAEFFVRRNYELWDAIAGARIRSVGLPTTNLFKFPPRSLPAIVSNTVFHRYYRQVANKSVPGMDFIFGPWTLEPVVPNQASEWVASGLSHYANGDFDANRKTQLLYVSDPTWHTPGWLYLDEFFEAIQFANVQLSDEDVEINAIIEATAKLEALLGFRRTRWVFWFDN